jgi:hypothetical protein
VPFDIDDIIASRGQSSPVTGVKFKEAWLWDITKRGSLPPADSVVARMFRVPFMNAVSSSTGAEYLIQVHAKEVCEQSGLTIVDERQAGPPRLVVGMQTSDASAPVRCALTGPSAGGAPQESPAAGGAPQESLAAGGAPQESLAAGGAPQESPAAGGAPQESPAAGGAPQESLAAGGAPQESLAAGSAPQESLAAGSAPQESLAAGSAPQESLAAGGAPQESALGAESTLAAL